MKLLSLHFVKEDILEPTAAHIFSKLMKYREEADYKPSYIFTKEDFYKFRQEAEILANIIRNYLKAKDYIT